MAVAGVVCTQCLHGRVPAVKSCLHCDASLCQDHLRVHSKAPEHVLCDPTASPLSRKCSVHNKILEYYCAEDSTCICVSCRLDGKHWGHQLEPLDKAFQKKKQKLRDDLQKLKAEAIATEDMIQQLQIKKEKLSRKMRYMEELCDINDPLIVLQEAATGDFCDTEEWDNEDRERHDEDLHDGGDLDVAAVSHTLHTGLSDIMSGVSVLKRTRKKTFPHSSTEDKVLVAPEPSNPCLHITPTRPQRKPTPIRPSPQATPTKPSPQATPTKPSPQATPTKPSPQATPTKPSPQPTTSSVPSKRRRVGNPAIEVVQPPPGQPAYADILLDVTTAANKLHITDDGKAASYSDANENHPDTPEKFQVIPQVMSSQSFSSGRHYWEVDVGKSNKWRVGMCYPSIARRGAQSLIGNNSKSWCLHRNGNQYAVIHDRKETPFPEKIPSGRIRIDLDYEAGEISFYALCDPTKHLHTFTTNFTEPLHAALWLVNGCIKVSGENPEM